MTVQTNQTQIVAPPGLPTIEITREFNAPVEKVYRAHVEPDLLVQWLGPRGLEMRVETHDIRRGGSYRYVHRDADGNEYGFWGAVHDVQPHRSITQTFGFDGAADSASLERVTFTDLGGGRTRLHGISVVFDVATRDAILVSGMERGVTEGYERLDDLLPGL